MKQFSNSTILAVETSCDDTCIATLETNKHGYHRGKARIKFKILSNVVSSQIEIHKKWGGVYPTLAKREHQKNLVPVLEKALKVAGMLEKAQSAKLKAQNYKLKFKTLEEILSREECLFKKLKIFLGQYKKPKINLIAVTVGPGLDPCLWVGVNFAKAIAYFWNLPIIPVNHIEAHILANFIGENFQFPWMRSRLPGGLISNFQKIFPAVCLVVSGGHTQLILMKDFGKYKIFGQTRDDAAGECFDKTAKILGLEYPGGPAIAANAANAKSLPRTETQFLVRGQKSKVKINLPRPMIYSKDYDFSFSGLKTAVLYDYKEQPPKIQKSQKYISGMAKKIQQAVIDVLIYKTIKAAENFKAKTIILGGGVTANKELRRQFKQRLKKEIPDSCFLIPDPKLCTDNAAMVAVAGYYGWLKRKIKKWREIKAEANLRLK